MSALPGLLLAAWVLLAPLPLALGVARRIDGGQGAGALAAAVTWCAVQIGVGLVLGLVHLLHLPGLLAAEALVAIAGVLWARRTGLPSPSRPSTQDAALGLVLAIAGGVVSWRFLATPPTNFDSIAYHLPAMVRWIQEAHLVVTPELGNAARYPFNWELLGAMVFLPLGSDLWVSMPNLVGWILLGLAVRTLAERMGASSGAAKTAAVLLLCSPTVLTRVEAIQPDIALAGGFVAALAFVDRARFHDRAGDRALALLCLAMLAGAKTSGLAYAVMVVVLGIAPAMWARRRERGDWGLRAPGMPLGPAVGLVAVTLLLGGTWYLRNWIATGNPIGFLEISLGSWVLFPGEVSGEDLAPTTLARIFDPARGDHWTLLGRVGWEWLGWPVAFLLVGMAGIGRDLRRSPHRLCRRLLVGVGASLVAAAVLYWHTPFSGDNGEHGLQLTPWIHVGLRYAYPALAALAVLGAAGLTAWGVPERWLWPLAVVAGLEGAVWSLEVATPVHVAITLMAFGLVLLSTRVPARWVGVGVGVGLVVMSTLATPSRTEGRARWYGEVDVWLRDLPDRQPRLGLVGAVRRYALYGPRWDRSVVEVPPRPADDARAWMERLRRARVARVVVPTGNRQAWAERGRVLGWIAAHPRVFTEEFAPESVRNDFAVYRFTPPIR